MWPFSLFKKKPAEEILVIPGKDCQIILDQWDKYNKAKVGADKGERFLLWSMVAEIYPQIGDGSEWTLHYNDRLKVYIKRER
jgi:hypothetical protein